MTSKPLNRHDPDADQGRASRTNIEQDAPRNLATSKPASHTRSTQQTPPAPAAARPRANPLIRRGLTLLVVLGVLLAVVLAVPSLGSVRHDLQTVNLWWLAAGIVLEIGSCLSFVIVFRAFFDEISPPLARRIAWIEIGSGALLPSGGVTSYALGGLLLDQTGMDRRRIIVRSGGVFWLTSAVNALAVAIGALLLLTSGTRDNDLTMALVPLLVASTLTGLIAFTPKLVARRSSLQSKSLAALVDGVADAWRAARRPSWRLVGAIGYLALDVAVLLCVFVAVGYNANAGAVILGYLVGYCAAMIPIPGGIGVIDGGIAGALILYGTPPTATAAAVLIYHAISFWIAAIGGLGAYLALLSQTKLDRETRPRDDHPSRRPPAPPPRPDLHNRPHVTTQASRTQTNPA